MKVEIWSDVMCPFCYIGKRKFEKALEHFDHKDKIEIIWKSFQLNPDMPNNPKQSINEYLAEHKGWSLEQAKQMNDQVTHMASEVGLKYDMNRAVVANSFDAHRFSHYAATQGLGDAAEEVLFRAYFTEGKNVADHETLIQLGVEIGLKAEEVAKVLASDTFTGAVQKDIYEAQTIGVRGVPFFVMNRKYAVSGAQPEEVFFKTLVESFDGWKEENKNTNLNIAEGAVCTPNGECG